MTWVRLEDVQRALSRVSVFTDAMFLGKADLRPQASFAATANADLTISFVDLSTDPAGGTITLWNWDFGDGQTATTQHPTHTYAAPGSYLVSLTVTSSGGLTGLSQAFQELVDRPDPAEPELLPPVASYTTSIAVRTVTFTDTSTDADGTIVSWAWDFGDGPIANFTFSPTNLVVAFTDTSTDLTGTITSRTWDFGDGTTSTTQNPSHTYAATGVYTVRLTIVDTLNQTAFTEKVVQVSAAAGTLGAPFGVFEGYASTTALKANCDLFNFSHDQVQPNSIVARINAASAAGIKLEFAMTGGAHSNYTTISSTLSGFDIAKWKAKMDTFNTPTIVAAVASAVANGVVVGNNMIDEPHHFTWGSTTATPPGGLTKVVLDQMHDYARAIFPTLPLGVHQGGQYGWRATEHYTKVDYVNYQYRWILPTGSAGNVALFRDNCLAQAAVDGVVPLFNINLLDGGRRSPEDPAAAGCPIPLTGGTGTFANNCRATASQVSEFGYVLGAASPGLNMWMYDTTMMASTSYRSSFRSLASLMATRPYQSWRRP